MKPQSMRPDEAPQPAWRVAIESVDASDDADLYRLKSLSTRFLDGPWLPIALAQGWDELELWGALPAPLPAMSRRYDTLGLVPMLITGLPCRLLEIRADLAVIERLRTGGRLIWRRRLAGREYSAPWWSSCAALQKVETE